MYDISGWLDLVCIKIKKFKFVIFFFNFNSCIYFKVKDPIFVTIPDALGPSLKADNLKPISVFILENDHL